MMYLLALLLSFSQVAAHKILIPMDLSQTDHLKAYGVAYWALEHGSTVEWLLNYRGGSFLTEERDDIKRICLIRGVSYEVVDASRVAEIYATVESSNMEVVRLEKAPSIAVFVPPTAEPWDDAVRMALEYAEIPYTTLWVREVLEGQLENYDWLHLHHEDFTGQYGKFYAMYHNTPWYRERQRYYEETARSLGFHKVSEMLKAVAFKIREYVQKGGFLFAMCSATDTIDIALAAAKTDICDTVYDGDPPDPSAQEKLDFSLTFAFEDFHIILDPYRYEFSDIDVQPYRGIGRGPEGDAFTLFDFSAKYDPVPTMLVQNHTQVVKGFLGQTSAFHRRFLKKSVVILGQVEGTDEVKYIHGNLGKGTFTFLAGHDPEDYRHLVGDPPTQLSLHKHSPGYRLILNNILFPAAEKKKLKT
ncbi:MAG: asparagine synthetase B [Candidatus Latescibacterota bacterium]|nr:MAG: asparagine synthetase B [Candidatus Latescibacterota bacterium]